MNLTTLNITPPWDWPDNAKDIIEAALRDGTAEEVDRLVAAELAGSITLVDDDLAVNLLAVLHDSTESEEMRARTATSLGPILELADTDGFEDPDEIPIAESRFRPSSNRFRSSMSMPMCRLSSGDVF